MSQAKKSPEIDIYKGHKEQILSEFEKRGYKKEKIEKQLKEIAKKERLDNTPLYKESIDNNLTSVENRIKKYVDYLEGLIKKEEKLTLSNAKEKAEQAVDDVKKKAGEKVDEVKKEVTKKIIEKTGFGKIMDKFTGFFDKIGNVFDTLWKKFLAASGLGGLLSYFGLGDDEEPKEEEKKKDDNKTEENKDETEKESKQDETEEEKTTPAVIKTDTKIETKSEIVYIAGMKTLLSLTGIKIEKNNSTNDILKNIREKNYTELKEISINSLDDIEKKKLLGTTGNSKTFETIQNQFKSNKFETLANYYFSENILEKTIKSNGEINERLASKIKGGKNRLEDILNYSSGEKDWWKTGLNIEEISLLYTESFNILKLPSINLGGYKTFMGGMLFGSKEGLKEVKNDFISKNIIENFGLKGLNFGGTEYIDINKDEEVKLEVGKNLNEKDKEQLNKIIDFKNELINYNLDNFGFSETQKEIFKNNLNYKWIIGLYSLMGGNLDFKNQNAVNKLSIVYLNSKVLGVYEGSLYLGKLLLNYIKDEDSIFTEEELKILGIYKDKMLDIGIMYNLSEIGKKLGFAEGLTDTDLNKLALSLGGGGTLSYLIGNKLIAKGIEKKKLSILGGIFKKVGIIGIISGLAVGGYKFYQSNHMKITIGNDLEKAKDDPKKLLEILEKYNNSIKHEKINGKDIEIITYKNDTPLIKMDNKIYTFDFVDESLSEKFKKTNFTNPKEAKNFGKAIVKEFFSILPDSNTTKINGKVINRGNIKIDGEKVIFGKDGEEKLTFNIRDLLNGIGNIVIDESYVKKINEWFRNELSKDIVINGEDTYFYPLKKLSDGKIISLVQIGELDQQKNGK